jgi:hypothetical protein
LEKELANQVQQMGCEREPEQQKNLRIGFEEVQPISFTDLAFVVWCGEQLKPVAETARTYRLRRDNGVLAKDYYPYISLQESAVPDSRGMYVFREEFPALIQETLEMLSRRDAADITFQMYSRPIRTRTVITRDNFQDKFGDLISPKTLERVGLDKMYNLFMFITKEYDKALSFTYCAAIADRACCA